jgi:hypothetical protein
LSEKNVDFVCEDQTMQKVEASHQTVIAEYFVNLGMGDDGEKRKRMSTKKNCDVVETSATERSSSNSPGTVNVTRPSWTR